MALETESQQDLMAQWERAGQVAEAIEKGLAPPPKPAPTRDALAAQNTGAEGEDTPAADDGGAGAGGGESANGKADGAGKATAKSAVKAAPAPGAPVGVGTAEERTQFEALARKLGMVVDGNRVTVAERATFRQQRQQKLTEVQQIEAAARQRAQQIEAEAQAKVGPAMRAQAAWDAGDYDGFAKALGKKDWNELNREAIGRFADPNYKRVRELETWKEQQEASARQAQQVQAAQQQEAQRQQAIAGYKAELSAGMKESTDRVVRAFHDDPQFLDAVYAVQNEHFDGVATITPEEAAHARPRGGGKTLAEEMHALYLKLDSVFRADAAASEHESAAQATESDRAAPKPVRQSAKTSIPQRKATEAAAPGGKYRDEKHFLEHWTARMQQGTE